MLTPILLALTGCVGDYNADRRTNIDDLLHVISKMPPLTTDDVLTVCADWGCTDMALLAYSTWTQLGAPVAHQSTGNVMVTTPLLQNSDDYTWEFSPAAGDDDTYARIATRNASSGIVATCNTNTPFAQFWMRIGASLPDKAMSIGYFSTSAGGTPVAALALNQLGKVEVYNEAACATGTPTTTGSVALAINTIYRVRFSINVTTGAGELLIYNNAGTLVENIAITTSGGQWGASVIYGLFLGHGDLVEPYTTTYPTPTGIIYFGTCLIDGAAYPDADARVGMILVNANGTHTGFTAFGAAEKYDCVNDVPLSGATIYITSSTGGSAYTGTLQTCASQGITGTIIGFSPFYIGHDAGGAVTIGTRLIENGTTTDTTLSDPGAVENFHLRGKLLTAMPSDGSAPTIAKLNACEVGVIQGAANVEVRVSLIGIHVIYIPAPVMGTTVYVRSPRKNRRKIVTIRGGG